MSQDHKAVFAILSLVFATLLGAGWMIGHAAAHSSEQDHRQAIECIDHGGNMIYVKDIGKICSTEREKIESNR